MRLVSVRTPTGVRAGVVACVEGVDRVAFVGPATSVLDVLTNAEVCEAARAAAPSAESQALSEVQLDAPIRPGKLLCLGYNYRGHVPDGVDPTASDPEFPDVFVKTPNTIGGPNDPVVLPPTATDADYEGEIAIVIAREAHNVAEAEALDYVGGYTILNDVSDRAWQRRQSQWALGKCADGFAPLGPWVVTRDEIADPQDMLVEVIRDGEITVSQSTSTTIFSAAFVVHYLSQFMTLYPGDIVSTGTPQKLPQAQGTHRPLVPGDSVTVRVSGIGSLTTTFISNEETQQ